MLRFVILLLNQDTVNVFHESKEKSNDLGNASLGARVVRAEWSGGGWVLPLCATSTTKKHGKGPAARALPFPLSKERSRPLQLAGSKQTLLVGMVGSCLALCSAGWLSLRLLPLKRLCLWPLCSRPLWLGHPTSQLPFHLEIHPPGNLSLLILVSEKMSGGINKASLLKQRCRKELGSEYCVWWGFWSCWQACCHSKTAERNVSMIAMKSNGRSEVFDLVTCWIANITVTKPRNFLGGIISSMLFTQTFPSVNTVSGWALPPLWKKNLRGMMAEGKSFW